MLRILTLIFMQMVGLNQNVLLYFNEFTRDHIVANDHGSGNVVLQANLNLQAEFMVPICCIVSHLLLIVGIQCSDERQHSASSKFIQERLLRGRADWAVVGIQDALIVRASCARLD